MKIFKHWKTFKSNMLEFYNLFFAAIVIFDLFFWRLLPRISRDLWVNMNYYQLFSTLIQISIMLLHIYILLKLLGIIKQKEQSPWRKKLKDMGEKIAYYFSYRLVNFYEFISYVLTFIVDRLFGYKRFHYTLMYNFFRWTFMTFNDEILFKFLIGIKLLPRIIFTFVFGWEVLFFQHLHYTFSCLPWLLVSLLEPFLIFICENFFERTVRYLFSLMKITELGQSPSGDSLLHYTFRPKNQIKHRLARNYANFHDFYFNDFAVLKDVKLFVEDYKEWKYKHFPLVKIRLSLCFIRLLLLIFILLHGVI